MDGIDGILAVQTLFFCLAAQLITGGVPGWEGALLWLMAGAMLGFLVYNWTPARIFMGDTGSVFLGLVIGVAVVQPGRAVRRAAPGLLDSADSFLV